jgi:hypothetical protein
MYPRLKHSTTLIWDLAERNYSYSFFTYLSNKYLLKAQEVSGTVIVTENTKLGEDACSEHIGLTDICLFGGKFCKEMYLPSRL